MPKRFPSEYRARVLALLDAGRSVKDVAADLGISQATIYGWRKQHQIDLGLRPGVGTEQSGELAAARRRIRELEEQVAILQQAADTWREVVRPKDRFALIADLAAKGLSVQRATSVLGVTDSGYYAWRVRAPSARSIRHTMLTDAIRQAHEASRQTYGARRIHAELTLGRGLTVGRGAVELLMGRAGLQGLPGPSKRLWTPNSLTAADLVDRNFHRDGPDQLYVTDITEHPTREGKVYCCVVLDCFSRRVVGWSIDTRQNAALATNALGMAISNRKPPPNTIIHSDHGVQFTSWAFTDRAKSSGLLPSMGSIGDPYDNAVVESFWSKVQIELLNRKRWNTRLELANAIFEYIEIFHNRQRRHSALGMLTPDDYETLHNTTRVA
jgi:putative transposase